MGGVGGFGVFFFQAEDGIRGDLVTGVQTCALPICKAIVNTYGSISATYIKFMNDLRGKLDTWLAGDGSAYASRNIQLVMLGYHPGFQDAPTLNVGDNDYTKLKDG